MHVNKDVTLIIILKIKVGWVLCVIITPLNIKTNPPKKHDM